MEQWKAVRKEVEVNEMGQEVPKRIIFELEKKKYLGFEKKDFIDFTLRIIGLTAIFIPVLLFYLQSKSESKKQKMLFQLDVYSKTSANVHTLLDQPVIDKNYEQVKNNFFYELYPKIILLDDKAVVKEIFEFKNHFILYSVIARQVYVVDSLVELSRKLSDLLEDMQPLYHYKKDSLEFIKTVEVAERKYSELTENIVFVSGLRGFDKNDTLLKNTGKRYEDFYHEFGEKSYFMLTIAKLLGNYKYSSEIREYKTPEEIKGDKTNFNNEFQTIKRLWPSLINLKKQYYRKLSEKAYRLDSLIIKSNTILGN